MSLSTAIIESALSHMLGESTWTAPAGIYVALFTTDPGYAGAGTEVSGGSYARVSHGGGSSKWVKNGDRNYENNGAVTFPAATGSWGTVTHFGLFDASSAGNYLGGGALTTAKAVTSGDTASFGDGELSFSVS